MVRRVEVNCTWLSSRELYATVAPTHAHYANCVGDWNTAKSTGKLT